MREPDFDLLARYYDLEHGSFTDDLPLYLGLASRTGSPILEFGCGTGRVLLALAGKGHRVTGIDVSEAMLAQARKKVDARPELAPLVRLERADARDLDLGQTFALAIWAINSFMHLDSQADQLRALESARRHLVPGGLLVLDLFSPDPATLLDADGRLIHDATWSLGESGHIVIRSSSRRLEQAEQRLEVTYVFDEVTPDGQVRRTVAPFSMRYLHRFEAQLLLERAGFTLEALYGTYDLDPFGADSPRMIFVARKGSG